MHRKYAGEGVICLSVSVDERADRAKALSFLQKQQATFTNYHLDEEIEVWQERFKVKTPGVVFVFDRAGKRAGKLEPDEPDKNTYEDVEKLVKQLLRP
jgi:hypothetical protein